MRAKIILLATNNIYNNVLLHSISWSNKLKNDIYVAVSHYNLFHTKNGKRRYIWRVAKEYVCTCIFTF